MVVAAGAWQVPLISFFRNKGHNVTVVDPYTDSPGTKIADKHIQEDVRDENKIFEAIKDLNFDFIVTDQSDISVETCNNLALRRGLPANNPEAVKLFVNKYHSRDFSSKVGMPVPAWRRVASFEELKAAIKVIGLPAILKPPDNQASCGIYKLTKENFDTAEELMQKSLEQSRTGYILCEEFVEGEHITVEGICSEGKHRSLASSTKQHFPNGVIAKLLYPTTVPASLLEKLFEANDKYVTKSGLSFGITHAEYIVDVPNNRFWLVEIACRGGGTLLSSDIAKWVSSVDLYEIYYNELHGKHTDLSKLQLLRRGAYLEFVDFGEGVVEEISGVEEANQIPGVLTLRLVFKKGDTIKHAENGRTRQGFFIVFGENHAEVLRIAEQVHKTVKVKLSQPQEARSESEKTLV